MGQFEPIPDSVVLPSELGRRILEIMEERGKAFTIQSVANRIGMHRGTLAKKLNGQSELYMFELRRIALAVKVSVERIMQEDVREEAKELKNLFETRENPKRAVEIAKKLVNLAIGITETCTSLNELGRAYFSLQMYEEAHVTWLEAYRRANILAQKEKNSDPTPLYHVIVNLTISYSVRKEYSSLTEILQKATPLFETNPKWSAIICYSMAKIAENLGDFAEARIQYYRSLEYYKVYGNSRQIAKAEHNAACFEYRQGNWQDSKELFEKALPVLEEDRYAYLLCLKEFSKTLLKLNETKQAEKTIRTGLEIIQSSKEHEQLKPQYYLMLSRIIHDSHYAEQVLLHQGTDQKWKRLACQFLMNYYEQEDDSFSLMKYYRIAKTFLECGWDIANEEEL